MVSLLVVFALAITFGLLAIFIPVLELEVILSRTSASVNNRLESAERVLSKYRSFERYLVRREREAQRGQLSSILESVHFLEKHPRLLSAGNRLRVGPYHSREEELVAFLDQFVPEYTKAELKRRADFFAGKSLDNQQVEAIVKNDTYNLVIAAAGSGKTKALTAKFAYLVENGISLDRILALTYTNPAREEMIERLERDYGIQNANVRTFHSFGRELAGASPNFRTDVADATKQREIIADIEGRLRPDRGFANLLLAFALELRTPEPRPDESADPKRYYEFLRNQKYITLNWKAVNSIAERDIANFLFLNQVKFAYESPAKWADGNAQHRQYHPDFLLPEYDLWVEHWAIDRHGRVPAWFAPGASGDPSERYREEMEWKRDQFRKHGQRLIETYSYQWYEDALIPELKRQLESCGVELRELTTEEMLGQIQNLVPRSELLHELMFSFISKAKTNGLGINDIQSKLAQGAWSRKQRAFANLMIQVWQEYESVLKKNDMIDFNDMITCALQVARDPKNHPSRYSHILIDEFQDITDPQLELVRCLLGDRTDDREALLFCVGDDWQNIFSFAGSNIRNIVGFEERFPHAEKTVLSTNYRCPLNIVEASTSVARMNRVKVDKEVLSASKTRCPIRLVECPGGGSDESYDDWEFQKAKALIEELLTTKTAMESIAVLARFNRPLVRLSVAFPKHEEERLEFLSIHKAKGTEADYVLLLGCVRGRNGFPSEMIGQRLLDVVERNEKRPADSLEEERRLFYVALTRCKKQLYIFTSRNERSRFVSEIQPYLTQRSAVQSRVTA